MSIQIDYRFPPGVNAEKQAKVIAIGQTVGSWDDRFSHREESFQRYLAKVIGVVVHDSGHSTATVEFPVANTEVDIGSLLTMIFGKFSMAGVWTAACCGLVGHSRSVASSRSSPRHGNF
jgi:2,3-diketo-5-methylthiopentyl-1-phosphate enolase